MIISCGQGKFPVYEDIGNEQIEEERSGNFEGIFHSLNPRLTGPIEGYTKLWIKGIQFYSKVVLKRGLVKIRYEQYIHSGSVCPNASNDFDGDGTLSISEVIRVSGMKLIPLDGKLRSQLEGLGHFPNSNKKGKYTYSRATAVFHLLDDLRAPDHSPNDFLGKLHEGESLELDQRTLILYSHLNNVLTPVACAVIDESFDF